MVKKIDRQKKKVVNKQLPTTTSIVCGTENPASLGCVFYEMEDGEIGTFFTAQSFHEGHEGIMHGGLSGAVLDELIGRSNSVYSKNGNGFHVYVTAKIGYQYHKPIPVGEKMWAFGRIERQEGNRNIGSGEIINEDGEVMVTATAEYAPVWHLKDDNFVQEGMGFTVLSPEDPAEL